MTDTEYESGKEVEVNYFRDKTEEELVFIYLVGEFQGTEENYQAELLRKMRNKCGRSVNRHHVRTLAEDLNFVEEEDEEGGKTYYSLSDKGEEIYERIKPLCIDQEDIYQAAKKIYSRFQEDADKKRIEIEVGRPISEEEYFQVCHKLMKRKEETMKAIQEELNSAQEEMDEIQ